MFDRSCHEAAGIERPEGEPTREEQVGALRRRLSGREVGDTFVYELLAAYRYSAIVVRIMNRWVERQMMAPDHDIWLHNPAADCLHQLLEA